MRIWRLGLGVTGSEVFVERLWGSKGLGSERVIRRKRGSDACERWSEWDREPEFFRVRK